jgi:hypothetical protein
MLGTLRPRRPGHATVVAYLALFVALGGTSAYAANTVFSTDIVDGEVKSADIGNNEIGSADVKDNTINTFDVHSFLGVDVVDGTLTGADIGDQTLSGFDIEFNTLTGENVGPDSIDSDEVDDNLLKDEDVGQSLAVDFLGNIGTVNAISCVDRPVTGLNALGDHLVLTPSVVDAHPALMYEARYDSASSNAFIHVCNWSNANVDDGTTHFNLLVFDAQ